MSGTNELEKHLLTRCYDSHHEILQVLESRYSTEGSASSKSNIYFKSNDEPFKKRKLNLLQQDNSCDIPVIRKQSTRKELKEYMNKTLTNQRKLIKKVQRLRKTGKPFDLQDYLDRYNVPKFENFIQMNQLWQSYIQNILSYDGKFQFQISNILPKLVNADFNGCFITVLQSRNTNVVGTRGIVVWDSQHSFIVVTPRGEDSREWTDGRDVNFLSPTELIGGFKVIPKQHTMFGFEIIVPHNNNNNNKEEEEEDNVLEREHGENDLVEGNDDDFVESIAFTIIGSRFELRSVDRSSKKFKNHPIQDVL
ncbi:POP4 [Candida oxycetoniae]|uniref:Ribonuclease P protein subunit n=1 Tax=Candida oxycetoniae TaxID=497107 RepID=A0AAI9WWV4_9ASCO|nr:POP4 [Candida oxycetoniae]KAI3403114.1 POP4 [Candida oxycetoniae]